MTAMGDPCPRMVFRKRGMHQNRRKQRKEGASWPLLTGRAQKKALK
jgi:hypothetical protein